VTNDEWWKKDGIATKTHNTWLYVTLKFRNGEPIYDGDSVAPCLVFCVVFYGLLLVFSSVFSSGHCIVCPSNCLFGIFKLFLLVKNTRYRKQKVQSITQRHLTKLGTTRIPAKKGWTHLLPNGTQFLFLIRQIKFDSQDQTIWQVFKFI
jgi:hypothetical protein